MVYTSIMKIKRLSIYNEFNCTGADCPASCCRGWRVPVDEEACLKYMDKKGFWGTLLRYCVVKKDGITSLRSVFNRCPFWGPDHLCALQKSCGIDYMPLVCVQFPRQLYHFGAFAEETLYLACPESARLFLREAMQDRPFCFTETEGDVSYAVNTTNDDAGFLDYLLQARTELIHMLQSGCPYDSLSILRYGKDAQNACLGQGALQQDALRPEDLPRPSAYSQSAADRLPMDCDTFDILFFNGFYHPRLCTVSPLLYRLCRRYIRQLSVSRGRRPSTANRRLAAYNEHLYRLLPNLDKLLNRYYEYQLLTGFLDTFEDYSFLKHLLFGMAKTNMLRLFLALYAQHRKQLSEAELARIIAVYERRAPQIEDALKSIQWNGCCSHAGASFCKS